MAKNKKRAAQGKKAQAAQQKNSSMTKWIVGAIALVAVVVLVAVLSANWQGDEAATAASQEGTAAQENDYAGRFLPAGYEAPVVADRTLYSEKIAMTEVTAAQGDGSVTIPLDAVTTSRIVRFDYTRSDTTVLPMIAYVKPSGVLFVGISYCPPCQGEGQRIETDGTLTCEACGTKRNLETNEGISGACKLYPLDEVPAAVDGDTIVVSTPVLDTWTAQPLDRPVG